MAQPPILVLGATGGQGGAVAAALLAHGARVRAMVRRPGEPRAQRLAERGVDVVAGSLDDRATLRAAMRGVDAVFGLTTPFEAGVDAEVAQGRAILAAVADAQVPHLVFSSVAGADQHSGVPHFDSKAIIERELASSGLSYTITAPTYFYDNALGGIDRIRAGILDLPLPPDRPLQQLARGDLGEFVAKVLRDPRPFVGKRIELASDAVTPAEMAKSLSAVVGRPVRHERTPVADPQSGHVRDVAVPQRPRLPRRHPGSAPRESRHRMDIFRRLGTAHLRTQQAERHMTGYSVRERRY